MDVVALEWSTKQMDRTGHDRAGPEVDIMVSFFIFYLFIYLYIYNGFNGFNDCIIFIY